MGGFELSGGSWGPGGCWRPGDKSKEIHETEFPDFQRIGVCVCVCVCVCTGIGMTCRLLFWMVDRTINKNKVNRRSKSIKKRVTYVHNLT